MIIQPLAKPTVIDTSDPPFDVDWRRVLCTDNQNITFSSLSAFDSGDVTLDTTAHTFDEGD